MSCEEVSAKEDALTSVDGSEKDWAEFRRHSLSSALGGLEDEIQALESRRNAKLRRALGRTRNCVSR